MSSTDIEQKKISSKWEMRDMLQEAVVKDLLGPANGIEEEIVRSVRDRYLVGKLAPKNLKADPVETEGMPGEGEQSAEDGNDDDRVDLTESLSPSSFGLTFSVAGGPDEIEVKVSWGNYVRGDSGTLLTETGKPKKVWRRRPAGGTFKIPLDPGRLAPIAPDSVQPQVVAEGLVRPPTPTGERIVSLFLVNNQDAPEKGKDAAWLFQPEISVVAPDGLPVFNRHSSVDDKTSDAERRALEMLDRKEVQFAVGHGVSVHADVANGSFDRAVSVRTQVVPIYELPITEPPTKEDMPGFESLVLDMKELANLDRESLCANLEILTKEYSIWIDGELARIDRDEVKGFEDTASQAIESCRKAKERLEEGVRTIRENDDALKAFKFANRAMWKQRVHGEYAMQRRRDEEVTLEAIDVPKNRSWRPFQLAFVLLAVPSLTDPHHADRTDVGSAIADLLWFPTGGGKTEAYLGIAAFCMAIRRLQGTVGGYDASHGLAVIMRYTLRLLTIQQFQRATTLLCAMESLRRDALENGDKNWGETPFRIGLWVGRKAAPNTTADARQAIQNARRQGWSSTGAGSPAQLTSCPWCGSKIELGSNIKVISLPPDKKGRTILYCSDPYGKCLFSERKAKNEGLPVVVVDEEIYRLLPTMLVSTVDKFAQMPWRGDVQALFGRVNGFCERHGFLTPESNCGDHRAGRGLSATKRQDRKSLRPPDLIIQDELHLINGPLGTLVGLYETAVDELATWDLDGKRVRPKIIASTATVRRAPEQVHNLFLRHVEVFPPHGLDAADNFFSIRRSISSEKPGRRYLGICAPGKDRPSVLIRVYVAFLTAAQHLYEQYGAAADPWMSLVGYFNSLRELGGMRRLVEDDVKTRCYRVDKDEFLVRPELMQRDIRAIEELTSRASSGDIPKVLDRLELAFSTVREKGQSRPIDVLLATNMVSVGVDVRRLGLMVVNGQPKTTAEYIQATSRVGRRDPGIVCSVLNWARPRDLSHYETFEHYHATFYQHVEALSVTPFAPRALDRGLTGILSSMVRLSESRYNENGAAGNVQDRNDAMIGSIATTIINRARTVSEQEEIANRAKQMLDDRLDQWVYEATRGGRNLGYRPARDGTTVGLLQKPGNNPWQRFTVPTSLREVEAGVSLLLRDWHEPNEPPWKESVDEKKSSEGSAR